MFSMILLRLHLVLAMLLCPLCFAGCSQPATAGSQPADRKADVDFAVRAQMRFQSAIFLKPASDTPPGRTLELAPLIVQQVLTPNSRAGQTTVGISFDSAGRLVIDADHPALYTATAQAVVHGIVHEQQIYV